MEVPRSFFLSHTGVDKDFRQVGAQLSVTGQQVFFDEWSIEYGESIPGALDLALHAFETFVLFWSSSAARSSWTRAEYESAVSSFLDREDKRLVVVRLDDEDVPALVRGLKWIDARTGQTPGFVVDCLLGFKGRERLIAMQEYISSLDLGFKYFEGYGVAVACARCGAGTEDLEGFHETDYERDDQYAGVRCKCCGWNDGGEI